MIKMFTNNIKIQVLIFMACFAGFSLAEKDDRNFIGLINMLQREVPPYPNQIERGVMLNCDGVYISRMRLHAWAKKLTPITEQEENVLIKYAKSNVAYLRYISLKALAIKIGGVDWKLPNDISFSHALSNIQTKEYNKLKDLVFRKLKNEDDVASP